MKLDHFSRHTWHNLTAQWLKKHWPSRKFTHPSDSCRSKPPIQCVGAASVVEVKDLRSSCGWLKKRFQTENKISQDGDGSHRTSMAVKRAPESCACVTKARCASSRSDTQLHLLSTCQPLVCVIAPWDKVTSDMTCDAGVSFLQLGDKIWTMSEAWVA